MVYWPNRIEAPHTAGSVYHPVVMNWLIFMIMINYYIFMS